MHVMARMFGNDFNGIILPLLSHDFAELTTNRGMATAEIVCTTLHTFEPPQNIKRTSEKLVSVTK